MSHTPIDIVFDARVVSDHFPGIGRYAYTLLAELPNVMDAADSLTVLFDPAAKNTHLPPLGPSRADSEPWRTRISWLEHRMPIFNLKNVLAAPGQLGLEPSKSRVHHYPYYVRPRSPRPPSVTTIFDAIPFLFPNYLPSAQARLSIRLLHQIAIGASRIVLTLSQSAASDLARAFPSARDKLVVTPFAPDPVFRPPSPESAAAARAKFGLGNDEPFVFFLASNKPHKNLVRLVEAWGMVRAAWSADDPPRLLVAGRADPRYPEAQQRAQALGLQEAVRFAGPVSDADAVALYGACDLFVYPSLYEGFGLTPLEAMACGAPVACSNASSLPEVTGDAAVQFDPTQVEAIAQACLRVLTDAGLRADLRARSLAQAARFSLRETARHTIAAYREVASSG